MNRKEKLCGHQKRNLVGGPDMAERRASKQRHQSPPAANGKDSPEKKQRPRLNVSPADLARRWITAFVDYLRSECQLSENTVSAYKRDLARFNEWLGGRRLAHLTIRDLSDFAGK